MKATLPLNEEQRLKTLRDYDVLDTFPEQAFEDLTLLAAQICQTPIALITLVDEQRQWFKSKIGLSTTETSRDIAFCAHAILYADKLLEVRDAQLDPRFADNPLVTDGPRIRFYAGAPLVTPDGSALGTLCVIDHEPRELSPVQKQSMQALSRQVVTLLELRRSLNERKILEERTHLVVESAPNAILIVDETGRITLANAQAESLFGYPRAELIGQMIEMLVPERFRDVYPRDRDIFFSDPHPRAMGAGRDLLALRKDGREVPVEIGLSPLVTREGAFMLISIIDISERKKTQLALEQFKFTLDQTVDCIFMCRADDFRFVYVNKGAKRLVGYTEAELYAMTVPDIKPEYTTEQYRQLVQPLLDGAQPSLTFETLHRHKDGHDIPVEITLQAVQQTNQAPRLVAVVRDITERKRTDKLLRTRNEELKGFAYTVSHDLKAPLRGISGYAQELERRHKAGLTERAQFCITQIITASHNLDALIEDLLSYARLDAETPSLTGVDLPGLLSSILNDRSHTLTELGAEVSINVPPLTLHIWERGLHQVLTNLIDNAIQYSRNAQPPRLTISAEATKGGCRITVADNGIGFDMKYHDRIFGLFNRLVRANEFEGTGAGLAIVKKLLEKLGGTIRAESAPGQGATFFVELPAFPATEPMP